MAKIRPLLTPGERKLLKAMLSGPVQAVTYRGGKPSPEGRERRAALDELTFRGLANFLRKQGDQNSPTGDVWSTYEITDLGGVILQVAEGVYECDPEDLEHPGCG